MANRKIMFLLKTTSFQYCSCIYQILRSSCFSLLQVWVLTGDKEETAVNISQSAGHFDDSMSLLGFTSQTSEADAYSNLLNLKDRWVLNVLICHQTIKQLWFVETLGTQFKTLKLCPVSWLTPELCWYYGGSWYNKIVLMQLMQSDGGSLGDQQLWCL